MPVRDRVYFRSSFRRQTLDSGLAVYYLFVFVFWACGLLFGLYIFLPPVWFHVLHFLAPGLVSRFAFFGSRSVSLHS